MTIDTQKLLAGHGSIAPLSPMQLDRLKAQAFQQIDCGGQRGKGIYVAANDVLELVAAARTLAATQAALDVQAALIAALRQPWQHIETAPRDGSWILAWRGQCGPPGEWDPMVIVCWFEFDDGPCWAWPNEVYDPWTSEGAQQALQHIEAGDWWASDDFTHWMPLPAPPAATSGEANG